MSGVQQEVQVQQVTVREEVDLRHELSFLLNDNIIRICLRQAHLVRPTVHETCSICDTSVNILLFTAAIWKPRRPCAVLSLETQVAQIP